MKVPWKKEIIFSRIKEATEEGISIFLDWIGGGWWSNSIIPKVT
jgi:hypothetical protein